MTEGASNRSRKLIDWQESGVERPYGSFFMNTPPPSRWKGPPLVESSSATVNEVADTMV